MHYFFIDHGLTMCHFRFNFNNFLWHEIRIEERGEQLLDDYFLSVTLVLIYGNR